MSTPKKTSKGKRKPACAPKAKPKSPAPIGTKNESSLHRALKLRYAGPGGRTEEAAGGFVADAVNKAGEYIEVQTGSFAPLIKKVKAFAANAKVRIVYPVAAAKIIEVYKPARGRGKKIGALLYRRRSPAKGSLWNLFDALVYAPELPLIRGVAIEVVLADITEKRVKDGKGSWRRKGVSIHDRELSALRESVILRKPSDYLRFIPFKKKEEFTASLLAERAGVSKRAAWRALYVLAKLEVVQRSGKKGNSWIYIKK